MRKNWPRISVRMKLAAASLLLVGIVLVWPCDSCADRTKLAQEKPRAFAAKLASVPSARGPVVPGLRQGAIPQGLAWDPESKRMLISHYRERGPACVSILENGKLVSAVTLHEKTGKPHEGHAGGLAIAGDSVFVASDGLVLQYDLTSFTQELPPESATPERIRNCETNADFCTATDKLLLVGEFAYRDKYPTRPSHHLKDRKGIRKYAWVCGYDLDDPSGPPTCVLSVRQKVQGMCVSGDLVFLSVSYGRRNRSLIVVYRNPIGQPAHRKVKVKGGRTAPLWFLDGENYLGEIDFPPMSEGIVMINNRLAVLSESGAEKYQTGSLGPLDVILSLDVSSFREGRP